MSRPVIFDMGGVQACSVWEHLLLDEKRGIPLEIRALIDGEGK